MSQLPGTRVGKTSAATFSKIIEPHDCNYTIVPFASLLPVSTEDFLNTSLYDLCHTHRDVVISFPSRQLKKVRKGPIPLLQVDWCMGKKTGRIGSFPTSITEDTQTREN